MLNSKSVIIIAILLVCTVSLSFTDTNSDLKDKTQQLDQLKQDINSKKAEKIRLLKEEKKVKIELKKISESISNTEKQLKELQLKIKIVEKKLASASRQYSDADIEKHIIAQQIEQEFLLYSQRKLTGYFDYPLEFKIRYLSIQNKSKGHSKAINKEVKAKVSIGKYDKEKKEILSLKNQQQTLINKNKKLQKDKSEILKTTAGKRVQAEQDIKALNDSAKALESLVKKLMQANENNKSITSLRSASTTRKHNLPWPVEGKVVLNFGKNKHPDLDTNVISNGIKIKAQNNAIIKSIDAGTVVFTGEFRSYGKIIIIDHQDIFFSVYGQLDDILVSENQKVIKGSTVAKVGADEKSVLYFEIRQYNIPEDPKLWLIEK